MSIALHERPGRDMRRRPAARRHGDERRERRCERTTSKRTTRFTNPTSRHASPIDALQGARRREARRCATAGKPEETLDEIRVGPRRGGHADRFRRDARAAQGAPRSRARAARRMARDVRARGRSARDDRAVRADDAGRGEAGRRHRAPARREEGHQDEIDGDRGGESQRGARAARRAVDRDGSRRIHSADQRQRAAEPHHRARAAPGQGRDCRSVREDARAGASHRHFRDDPRGARGAASAFPVGGHGCDGRQLLDRRDGFRRARDERGQRRNVYGAAARACGGDGDREGVADARGSRDRDAPVAALGDRAEDVELFLAADRRARRRRRGRARARLCRARRRRPQRAHRRRIPGDAPLHSLRRVHESLPGLSESRWARVRLGVSGADGLGADAELRRARQCARFAAGGDALRRVRQRLSGRHPDFGLAAQAARKAGRAAPAAVARARGTGGLGLFRAAAGAVRARDEARGARARAGGRFGGRRGGDARAHAVRGRLGPRLDGYARHPGPRRADVPRAVCGVAHASRPVFDALTRLFSAATVHRATTLRSLFMDLSQ
ncbi:iron-sulfur cluster-binding protein [Burkholderia pseudomallei MSHR1043]|nr:iron-sulfur cluster-binding protein [Burkholderia pseudomallei MSHR1043]